MEIRTLMPQEISPELFGDFYRYQEITHCWCREGTQWVVRLEHRIIENWDDKQKEFVCWCLKEILSEGGMAAGAFLNGVLKGIVAVEGKPIGSRGQYLPVAFLQVSRDLRRSGVGKQLFSVAKAFAAEKGAERLYLSSQPSVEAQAFYKAMGCVEAEEYSAEYVAHNPRECQIEYRL